MHVSNLRSGRTHIKSATTADTLARMHKVAARDDDVQEIGSGIKMGLVGIRG